MGSRVLGKPRPNTKRPHQPPQKPRPNTKRPHQPPQKARLNTKRPHQTPPKGQAKHETPTPNPTKRPGQTRNAPPQKPGANTKRPHQNLPKGLTFTRLQASPPHEMRKGRAAKPRAPFAFRGAWGDFVPPQKKSHFGGLRPPTQKKLCREGAWRGWSRVAVISL